MVTGGAGSIGSELCRQLCKFHPKQLVIFDFSETGTYQIDMELRNTYPDCPIVSVIGNVRDRQRVESQLSLFRPNIISTRQPTSTCPLWKNIPAKRYVPM